MGISIRLFDCGYGRPAADMLISVSRDLDGTWHEEVSGRTGEDGYLAAPPLATMARGVYRLEAHLDEYFAGIGITPFHPKITVVFRVADVTVSHYIPLLFTQHAYMVCSETLPEGRLV